MSPNPPADLWNGKTRSRYLYGAERSKKVIAFCAEVAAVCIKYGLALDHEDSQGGFRVRTPSRNEVAEGPEWADCGAAEYWGEETCQQYSDRCFRPEESVR